LVKIKIGDIVLGAEIRTRAIVIQQKAGKPVQFELTADVRASLLAWLERRGGSVLDYVSPSRVDHAGHLSTGQYARRVDEWVDAVGLRRAEYDTRSFRRTKALTPGAARLGCQQAAPIPSAMRLRFPPPWQITVNRKAADDLLWRYMFDCHNL
jgi:integrase